MFCGKVQTLLTRYGSFLENTWQFYSSGILFQRNRYPSQDLSMLACGRNGKTGKWKNALHANCVIIWFIVVYIHKIILHHY